MNKLFNILFLVICVFCQSNNVISEEKINKNESTIENYQYTVNDFKIALVEFCQLVERKDYNSILQLVVLPIPGSEYVLDRYDDKGLSKEEFKINYEKIFSPEIITLIKTIELTNLNLIKNNDKSEASATLMFQFENTDSISIYIFEFINGKYKLIKIVNAD